MGNAFAVPVCGALGFVVGMAAAYSIRNRFWRWYATIRSFQHFATVADWLLTFGAGGLMVSFELWKLDTIRRAQADTFAAYAATGVVVACSASLKWLISVSKENDKLEIKKLGAQIETEKSASKQREAKLVEEAEILEHRRDAVVRAQAQVGVVVEAKQKRLAELLIKNATIDTVALIGALAPKDQIFLLIKMLRDHFARDLPPPLRLRVGIYARSMEDPNTLVALYSWDGEHDGCFSNKHQKYLRLDNPGGAQSLVVECFLSKASLLRIADCVKASQETPPRFTFFSPEQREQICSIVAYRYVLHHEERLDAFILTLDTNLPGFFADSRDFECQMLLQETGKRIELELIELELIKKLRAPNMP